MTMIHQIRRDTELARLKYPGVEIHLLAPVGIPRAAPLDFDPGGLARALELGRAMVPRAWSAGAETARADRAPPDAFATAHASP